MITLNTFLSINVWKYVYLDKVLFKKAFIRLWTYNVACPIKWQLLICMWNEVALSSKVKTSMEGRSWRTSFQCCLFVAMMEMFNGENIANNLFLLQIDLGFVSHNEIFTNTPSVQKRNDLFVVTKISDVDLKLMWCLKKIDDYRIK